MPDPYKGRDRIVRAVKLLCTILLEGRKDFPSTFLGLMAGSMKYTDTHRQINRRESI